MILWLTDLGIPSRDIVQPGQEEEGVLFSLTFLYFTPCFCMGEPEVMVGKALMKCNLLSDHSMLGGKIALPL